MWSAPLADSLITVASGTVSFDLKAYPNPAGNHSWLEWTPPAPGHYEISLIAMDGKTVLKKNVYATGIHFKIKLDTTPIEPGLYLLNITGNQVSTHTKLMVSKN